jgi:hypothetical protein
MRGALEHVPDCSNLRKRNDPILASEVRKVPIRFNRVLTMPLEHPDEARERTAQPESPSRASRELDVEPSLGPE